MINIDWIYVFISTIFSTILSVFWYFVGYKKGKKERKTIIATDMKNGWIDIKKHPPQKDYVAFILTDGEKVSVEYSRSYDKDGDIKIGFIEANSSKATHWMPMPLPPKKCKEKIYEL